MKLKKEFITHQSGGEALLVPTGEASFAGIVKGNKTLGAILEALRKETSEEEVVSALCARFDAPREVIARDVRRALDGLRGIGALDE